MPPRTPTPDPAAGAPSLSLTKIAIGTAIGGTVALLAVFVVLPLALFVLCGGLSWLI